MDPNEPAGGPYPLTRFHAFVVRIWRESGLTRPNGHPLWRGQVRHVASGRALAFQSTADLLRFIREQVGPLDDGGAEDPGPVNSDPPTFR